MKRPELSPERLDDLRRHKVKGAKDLKCPKCDSKLTLRLGRFGRFYGCKNFPTCKGSLDADDVTGQPNIPTAQTRLEILLDPNWID